jgi:hypothetical protein
MLTKNNLLVKELILKFLKILKQNSGKNLKMHMPPVKDINLPKKTGLMKHGKKYCHLQDMEWMLIQESILKNFNKLESRLPLCHLNQNSIPLFRKFSMLVLSQLLMVKELIGVPLKHLLLLLLLMKDTMYVYQDKMLKEELSHIDMLTSFIKTKMDAMCPLTLL